MAAAIFFHLLILLSIFTVCRSQSQDVLCMYSMYVGTGSIAHAGTNATITLELWDKTGSGIRIMDLARDAGFATKDRFDYFEPGNVDFLSFRGPCLAGPLCGIKIMNDLTGPAPGWYCEFFEITTIGLHQTSLKRTFPVIQWLARDPYKSSAVVNFCGGGAKETSFKLVTV